MRKTSLVGYSKIMNNGMLATVIADRGANDIDIQFEDGTIVHHKRKNNFNKGIVANPSIGRNATKLKMSSLVGQSNTMKNGMLATVIEDRGRNDIDIQFEDGTIVEHTRRDRFITGDVANPTLGRMYYKVIINSIVGQTNIMKNGMHATVIADRGAADIDVQFENGTIVYHKSRLRFNQGLITPFSHREAITGQANIMNNGMSAVVIADRGGKNIDVQFEDGTIVYCKTRTDFRKGNIKNPSIQGRSRPQAIVYFFVKKYFPDAIQDYRPDWLKNKNTSRNLELDIWIPSKRIGIEYDGFISSHSKKTALGVMKRDFRKTSPLF